MKLIIQIPCFNEEEHLPATLADLPRQLDGIDDVEILVVDDGSSDRTAEVARREGAHHLVRHTRNRGLAAAFRTGVDACLALGADIIVNTDADNQYAAADIDRLIAPILGGEAEIVVGDRRTDQVAYFSPLKKKLQRLGSFVVRHLSHTEVPDAVSGFRAISRDAARRINVLSSFSYTIEMLIQAGNSGIAVTSVPIRVNPQTRESRLASNAGVFIQRSLVTMLRAYAMYHPLRVFTYIGVLLSVLGLAPIARFLYFYFENGGAGHVQSLVLGGVLVIMGFFAFLIGLVADLIGFNRKLLETMLEKIRRLEGAAGPGPSG
ncbi:MAG: glycosyltransferase family 2 protein [Acidobacteriota bacterium]